MVGSLKAEKEFMYDDEQKKKKKSMMSTSMACLFSFLISIIGGLVLAWWAYQYYSSNTHQWMVPLGLVLSGTPIVIWFSLLASELCESLQVHVVAHDESGSDHCVLDDHHDLEK